VWTRATPFKEKTETGGITMYAVIALIGLMLLTWAVAVWASYREEAIEEEEQSMEKKPTLRKVA
jgi:hypothetical protein